MSPSLTIGSTASGTSLKLSSSTIGIGQSLTLTATATAARGASARTGSITFMDGSTILGVVALNTSSVAAITFVPTAMGRHSYTAVYSGDSTFATSKSTAHVGTVGKDKDAIVLTSPTTQPVTTGESVVLTATITTPVLSNGVPTGTVTFKNGRTILGSASVNSSGVATITATFSATGKHTVSTTYSGDTLNNAGSSAGYSINVIRAATAVVVSSSVVQAAGVSPDTANPSASPVMEQVFTATVSRDDSTGLIPTGSVVFRSGAPGCTSWQR